MAQSIGERGWRELAGYPSPEAVECARVAYTGTNEDAATKLREQYFHTLTELASRTVSAEAGHDTTIAYLAALGLRGWIIERSSKQMSLRAALRVFPFIEFIDAPSDVKSAMTDRARRCLIWPGPFNHVPEFTRLYNSYALTIGAATLGHG